MSLYTIPGRVPELITNNNTTNNACRGIYVGTAGDYDLYDSVKGAWVVHKGMQAGIVYPLVDFTGARVNGSGAAPASGDIIFYVG